MFIQLHRFGKVERPENCDSGCVVNLPDVSATDGTVKTALSVLFGAAAAIAVVIIVAAALNITTGGGDPEKISKAKKTIIFALIGLMIAISAEFIVLTILDKI